MTKFTNIKKLISLQLLMSKLDFFWLTPRKYPTLYRKYPAYVVYSTNIAVYLYPNIDTSVFPSNLDYILTLRNPIAYYPA